MVKAEDFCSKSTISPECSRILAYYPEIHGLCGGVDARNSHRR
jgi:hypothetical protein